MREGKCRWEGGLLRRADPPRPVLVKRMPEGRARVNPNSKFAITVLKKASGRRHEWVGYYLPRCET